MHQHFLEVYAVLLLFLTQPITADSAQRTFSKLKMIRRIRKEIILAKVDYVIVLHCITY